MLHTFYHSPLHTLLHSQCQFTSSNCSKSSASCNEGHDARLYFQQKAGLDDKAIRLQMKAEEPRYELRSEDRILELEGKDRLSDLAGEDKRQEETCTQGSEQAIELEASR